MTTGQMYEDIVGRMTRGLSIGDDLCQLSPGTIFPFALMVRNHDGIGT